MPDNLKAGVESLSGIDMSDVRVHYNSDKPSKVGALAYTQGTNIHVASGQEKHLPHEAWHVVQQKQNRVQSTMQMQEGIAINDDSGLEREATEQGWKAKTQKNKDTVSSIGLWENKGTLKLENDMRIRQLGKIPIQCMIQTNNGIGKELMEINFSLIAPDTLCNDLFNQIFRHPNQLLVLDANLSFDLKTNNLFIPLTVIKELKDYQNAYKADKLTNEQQKVFVNLLPKLTHELSHALDFLNGIELIGDALISSEIKAWAKESLDLYKLSKGNKIILDNKSIQLINGWHYIKDGFSVEEIFTFKKSNELFSRLVRYTARKLGSGAVTPEDVKRELTGKMDEIVQQAKIVCQETTYINTDADDVD